ncbi:MAG TPA: HEAT repeat domain-containing protein [Steroidobacteraceae bacterium]|nr:HEAT repeat domain-containing protein [Steroidobacteraceae bacterium]
MNTKMIRAIALCLVLLALTPQGNSAEIQLPRDGWASWQVEAVEGAPAWCCLTSWNPRDFAPKSCRLDDKHGNFGSHDDATTDAARVYARVVGGQIERLRVLAATCPVEAATPIRDLGTVATADSTRLLITLSKSTNRNEDLYEEVLAGLAMHRGDLAHSALTTIASGDSDLEKREKAVFWLAQLRGIAGAEVATSLMFNDKNPQLRQHAAFAVSQSSSPRIAADLTRLGNTDPNGEVRGQAWFWLAQSEVPGAEEAIVAALRKDQDDEVREQAIAALAQLPDERATRALIAAAEDRSLSSEQRKRAVFWLAQSESQAAQKYLEKVLAGNATH